MTLNLTAEERLHCQVMQACLNAIQKDKPLILKGGTALMLGYGLERFSEDLDFDIADTYTGKGTIKLDSVLKNALPYGVELQELVLRKDTPSVTRYILRYQQNCISDKLKIEVSYRTPVKSSDIVHKNGNQFLSVAKIADFKINTVLNSDTDARTKARDLFDTVFIVKNYANTVNPEYLNQLKQLDINELVSRYEQSFIEDKIMQRHKISADEVILSLYESLSNIKPNDLTQLKQQYQAAKATLSPKEQESLSVAERLIQHSFEQSNISSHTREYYLGNFYRNVTKEIKNGTFQIPNPYDKTPTISKKTDKGIDI